MNKLVDRFLKGKHLNRDTYFWNALAASLNSFQTMLLLLVLTRFGTASDSSYFVMGYSVANLLYTLGKFGVRQYQVTDVSEKYRFSDYLSLRLLSMLFMSIGVVLALSYGRFLNHYTVNKVVIILLICVYKGIEAFEDVYHGRFQQKGRLDIAAKILATRLIVFVFGVAVLFLLTRNLILTILINTAVTSLLCKYLNSRALTIIPAASESLLTRTDRSLFFDCLPLCISQMLNIYIVNSPKYIIDGLVTDELQTSFNIIVMPVFVVALLGNFIFQPSMKKMGELWEQKDDRGFTQLIMKLSLYTVFVDAVVVAGGALLGIPVLELVYGVPLRSFRGVLIIFLIGGGVNAILNILTIALTAARYQKQQMFGYAVCAFFLLVLGRKVFSEGSFSALAILYLLVLSGLTVYSLILIMIAIRRRAA